MTDITIPPNVVGAALAEAASISGVFINPTLMEAAIRALIGKEPQCK